MLVAARQLWRPEASEAMSAGRFQLPIEKRHAVSVDGRHATNLPNEDSIRQLLNHWDMGQRQIRGVFIMDSDLDATTRDQLAAEVVRLRNGIRRHRDSTGHDLRWHQPDLWRLLPERPIRCRQ
jgi:hypothetical protein